MKLIFRVVYKMKCWGFLVIFRTDLALNDWENKVIAYFKMFPGQSNYVFEKKLFSREA